MFKVAFRLACFLPHPFVKDAYNLDTRNNMGRGATIHRAAPDGL
jgi:hypothetical protein